MGSNYQDEFDAAVASLDGAPRLLLHACCAPCSTRALELVSPHFATDILFYNPNIRPAAEYELRLETLRRLLGQMPLPSSVRLLDAPHRAGDFDAVAKGLETEPEGGARCARCIELRLRETARYAKAWGYDFFATTLTVGPRKNAELINTLGYKIASEYGVAWLPADFKKRDGYRRSVELSKLYGLYRQAYCGCLPVNG